TNVLSYLRYHALPAEQSFGLYPETMDGYRVTFAQPTPRALNSSSLAGVIRINEWMAINRGTLLDPTDRNYDDWLELYNPGSDWVDLTGYTLTDNFTNANQWRFPAGTGLPPGGYLLVWADEDGSDSGLHANFKLAGEGEEIALFSPEGQLVDRITFGPQT